MSDWVSDIKSSEENSESETESLFQDNFRRMVGDDEIDSLNPKTISNQIEQIDDADLLREAKEIDDREDAVEAYEDRLLDLASDGSEDEAEPEPEPEPEPEEDVAEGTDETEEDADDEEPEDTTDDDAAEELDETTGDDVSDDGVDEETVEEVIDESEETEETGSDESEDEVVEDDPDTEDEDEASDDSDADESDGSDDTEESDESSEGGPQRDDDDLPDVNVSAIAPGVTSRDEAATKQQPRSMLIWGGEGLGKTHVAHSSPQPVCVIDTEGKADDLADKFEKEVYYWKPSDYQEARDAVEKAMKVLAKYRAQGVTGTLVVDSMTVIWEWAQLDYAKFAYQVDTLAELEEEHGGFKTPFEGEKDWSLIKGRHNDEFRDVILNSPYNVVLTAGRKEDYDYDPEAGEMSTKWVPDGEKHNKYAVRDVVYLREKDGQTVADLKKASRTRYSFIGLEWPEWDDIYDAIEMLFEAEQADDDVDVTSWPFEVVKGQPVAEGSGEDDD